MDFLYMTFIWFLVEISLIRKGAPNNSEFTFSKWGEGDSNDLCHPLKIHVPKYQIKLLQNQKWKKSRKQGFGGAAPQNGGNSCVPIEY